MDATAPPQEETWNLADLYEDEATFDRAREAFRDSVLPSVDAHRGRMLHDAATLAATLEAISTAREQLQLLHAYASLRADRDTRKAAHQATRQEVELLATKMGERTSYLCPEILAGDPELIERFIEAEPRLSPYAFFLRDLNRRRAHVLDEKEERILAETGLLRRDPAHLYQVLTNAELPRPEVTLDSGENVRLTTVQYQRHRATAHRPDRMRVFPAYFSAYAGFRETLGSNLYAAIKGHVFRSRVRGYASCLAASLDPDHVPENVYRNLIKRVRSRLDVLHRYIELRRRSLGLERMEYPDLYCPPTAGPRATVSTERAREIVLRGLDGLGEEYGKALGAGFGSRWVDWHPAEGKRSGAYATGWAYAVHPFVLLNFNEDYESVLTLAHEMGHAMHSYFSNRDQPFPTADYSIFVAEVASTFNESMVLSHMLDEASGADETSLLSSYLDGIRGTLFRQTMFAEFELETHERAEAGEVMTGERLSEIYLRLLREYHGHDQGVMHIGEEYAIEWAAIPHFYYDFYVYQYATGIVAAHALAGAVAGGGAVPRERYLRFLSSGGSDYPLELLRGAGVDLESATPYDDAFATIESRLSRLEECLGV